MLSFREHSWNVGHGGAARFRPCPVSVDYTIRTPSDGLGRARSNPLKSGDTSAADLPVWAFWEAKVMPLYDARIFRRRGRRPTGHDASAYSIAPGLRCEIACAGVGEIHAYIQFSDTRVKAARARTSALFVTYETRDHETASPIQAVTHAAGRWHRRFSAAGRFRLCR